MAEPMYRQIAEDLQHRIDSGELQRGAQVPTEIELREQYDASRNTVRDAIKWLVTRGLVETRPIVADVVLPHDSRRARCDEAHPGDHRWRGRWLPAAKCGVKQVGYRDSIGMRAPGEAETAFFKLPGDERVPVFEIFRVGFDETGDRIRLTITVYPTDRNRFVINVGDVPSPRIAE
jgi:DNA-binding GntR family transcriptional regulator